MHRPESPEHILRTGVLCHSSDVLWGAHSTLCNPGTYEQTLLEHATAAQLESVRLLASIHLGVLAVIANAERAVQYSNSDVHYNNVVFEVDSPQATTVLSPDTTVQTGHTSTTAFASWEAFDFGIRVRLIDQGMARTNTTETIPPSTPPPDSATGHVPQPNLRNWLAKSMGYRGLRNILGEPWTWGNTKALWENPSESQTMLNGMTEEDRRMARIWCVLSAAQGVEYEQDTGELTLLTATDMLQRLVDMGVTTQADARRLIGEPQ